MRSNIKFISFEQCLPACIKSGTHALILLSHIWFVNLECAGIRNIVRCGKETTVKAKILLLNLGLRILLYLIAVVELGTAK